MKNKITLLIIASIIALVALSTIQGYLITNTYKLEKAVFIEETKKALSKIDNDKVLDSLFSDVWGSDLSIHLSDYKNQRITKGDVIKKAKLTADNLNLQYNSYYAKKIKEINLSFDIKYQKALKSLVLFQNKKVDSIYSSKNVTLMKLFGEDFNLKEANNISNSRWFTEFDYFEEQGENLLNKSYDLEVKSENFIEIKNWQIIVLGRMTGLLIASVCIFLFVIGLLYYSIKKLINLKKIDEIKTDFINNITHELKTPLATLSIASKSLKNKEIQNSKDAFNNTINIVNRQNERLQKLIDQVMTNSLSSKDIVLNKEQVEDNFYFNNLVEDFKLSVQYNNILLENEIYAQKIILRIDTFHFTTALLNILDNAIKYGKEDTKITIKTELKNANYLIKIQDNGIGISEKQQQQIFNKFYRVSEGNIHNVKGLGLGLYYANQIIKAHQGTITIESELNIGTMFTIKIPVN